MSSIVADLLQSTGKLAKENIVQKVQDLKSKLEGIKLEIQNWLKEEYEDFSFSNISLDRMLGQLKQATVEYDDLHNQIENEIKPQMVNSVAEFHDVLEDLQKIKILKSTIWDLVLLQQHLESSKSCQSQKVFFDAATHLLEFDNIYTKIDVNLRKKIGIIKALRAAFVFTRENLVYDMTKVFKQNIAISYHIEGKNKKIIRLLVNEDPGDYNEILKALCSLNQLRPVLSEFGKQFLQLVCKTLILNDTMVSIDNTSSTLTVTILNEQSPNPNKVFASLQSVFEFIYQGIFMLPVSSEIIELTAMKELGAIIREDFSSMIIEKCLKTVIPKQSSQFEAFYEQMGSAENFCNYLIGIGFFSRTNNSLLNFIKNVDNLSIDKMAQDILIRARTLMKKSLHQTVFFGVEPVPITDVENQQDVNAMSKNKDRLSKNTFSFPRCQISASMKELIKLFLEIGMEAKNMDPNMPSYKLWYKAQSICHLYCDVVPTFHREEIKNIPQQTAIFHNNCMYLAHELSRLSIQFQCDMQVNIPLTFADQTSEIKKLGSEAFLAQMRHQRQQLLQLLQEQQAYQTVMLDQGLINKAKKSIQQCLCQLKLLQKVWCDVLPSEVYFKTIGTLFNTCLEEIILRVLSMEDISADAAAQMDEMFAILLKQGPELFKISKIDKCNSVHLYVKKWFKFQELQLILSANLKEIVDRWASSKGPLSVHFTADEVKHLIRALFQNTERRAAALAKIK